jgi:hypothetical protein
MHASRRRSEGTDLSRPSDWAVEWNSPNRSALFREPRHGEFVMPSQSVTRPEGRSEVNLKTHSAPNSNTEKKPDDSDDHPMTGAPASCLKTLSEEFGESGRRHRHPVH